MRPNYFVNDFSYSTQKMRRVPLSLILLIEDNFVANEMMQTLTDFANRTVNRISAGLRTPREYENQIDLANKQN